MKRYQTSTEEFVSQFTEAADYTGDIARMVGEGIMPRAVDRDDARVKAIVARCRKNAAKKAS
jgi:hypothetical protein